MKKAVSIIVMIIMTILMISDVKACEMSYNEYKDRKMKSHKICKYSIRKCDRRGKILYNNPRKLYTR